MSLMQFARRIPNWMRLSLEPDEIIGRHKMRRWWILPHNRWFNAYLHNTFKSDERLLHDHPCRNVSCRLCGNLMESVPRWPTPEERSTIGSVSRCEERGGGWVWFDVGGEPLVETRPVRRFTFRRATQAHRLIVPAAGAWTLWIRGPNRRQWGFFTPRGWLPRREGVAYMRAEDERAGGG